MGKGVILILDLGERPGRIGILKGGDSITWHPLTDGLQGRKIVGAVHTFLRQQATTLTQMSAFVSVTKGSSFTGVRLGASVANAFAWVFGRPAVGIEAATSGRLIRVAVTSTHPNALIKITYPSHPILKANPR